MKRNNSNSSSNVNNNPSFLHKYKRNSVRLTETMLKKELSGSDSKPLLDLNEMEPNLARSEQQTEILNEIQKDLENQPEEYNENAN